MPNEIAVRAENLVKVFSGMEVIKGCNLSVKQGTIYGFLGLNGAGKTTVLKMLMGLLTPTAGKVTVFGKDMAIHRDELLRNIGSIIEAPIFYEHLSAEENLSLHLDYMNMQDVNISEVLEKVGLAHTRSQPVSKFSIGMRQRLGIARAIIHKPKLLLLDEPINGLDPIGILEMRKLFLDLVHNRGVTMIISSHILSEIEHIADTVGIIANGIIKQEISMAQIKKELQSDLEGYFFELMGGGYKDV